MRRHATLCFIATLALTASAGPLAAQSSKITARLEKGTPIPIRGTAKVSKIIEAIGKATGVAIKVVGDFGRPDARRLGSKASIAAAKPTYWDAVGAILEGTGSVIRKVEGSSVEIGEPLFGEKLKPAGAALAIGSFRLAPEFHTFFKRLGIRIHVEPWADGTTLESFRATLKLADETELEVSENSVFSSINFDRSLEAEIKPDYKGDETIAKTLDLEATLAVPVDVKQYASKTLGSLVAKPHDLGTGASLRLLGLAPSEEHPGRVRLRGAVTGTTLSDSSVTLVVAGNRLESKRFTSSGDRSRQTFEVDFETDSKSLTRASLEVIPRVYKTVTVGTIGDLEKSKAGLSIPGSKVRLKRISEKGQARITLEVEGEPFALDPVVLKAADSSLVEKDGHSAFSRRDVWNVSLSFPANEIKGDIRDYSLVVDASRPGAKKTIRNLTRSVAGSFKAGAAEILVQSFGEEKNFEGETEHVVRVEILGAKLDPRRIEVLGPKPLESGGWSSSGTEKQIVQLNFESLPRGVKLDRCKLRVSAPKSVLEHTIKARFKDVTFRVQ